MSWISENKTVWRLGVLVGVAAAIMGPWAFSGDGVTSAEWCDAPLVLMENNRCVKLVSGASVFAFIATAFSQVSADLVTGRPVLAQRGKEFAGVALFTLGGILLLLPVLSTLLLVLGRERRRLRTFHLLAWALAGLVALVLAVLLGAPGLNSARWGAWLFVGLGAAALALESLVLANRSGPT